MITPEIPWVAHGYRGAQARKHFCNYVLDEVSNRVICSEDFGHPGDTGFVNPKPRRIKSASVVHTSRDGFRDYTASPRRPQSAFTERENDKNISFSNFKKPTEYRIRSAGTMRTLPFHDGKVRTGLTFQYRNVIRTPREPMEPLGSDLCVSPDPAQPYFDRHSRCLNHDHVHTLLRSERPLSACVRCGSSCQENEYPFKRPTRRSRPQTAPSTRKEYDLAQKTDTLLHNVEPHFCNFVKKIELKPRRPTGVPCVREAFGTSDGEDELDGLESASTTSGLSDRRGAQARPSTPHKTGYTRRCARPRTVRPRSATMAKKKKPTGGKAKSKPKPAADDTQWAEKVFNLDAPAEKMTSKPSPPAPTPPAKKKKEVTLKTEESPKRVVKKQLTEKEEEQKPAVEMVETPPSPVPEPVVTIIEGPAVPSETPRPPPSPSLVDRRASVRSPRTRGQPPDISQTKESGDGDQESKNNMKQTVDTSMSDAALKKFVQSSSHAASHAGRLALSKQSSRFELPMDMMSLETLTPQEYLRKYCVVSSRRQSLYHKMFIKNKEPKKQTLQVKELVKALKDVLTDTLDDAMVSRVLDMTDVTEETQVDIKLFAGLAALSERMLYSKFVTEDTEGLQDHQKERIECADFFALDWKFHGVRVNEPMERLLRSL